MKKITLMFGVLLFGLSINAQEFTAESNTPASTPPANASQAIIWDQPSIGGNGIISDYSTAADLGVYSTDDFNLAESTRIDKITVYGFQNIGDLDQVINGFDIHIYENDGQTNTPVGDPTQPGTGVVEFVDLSVLPIPPIVVEVINDESDYTFIVDVTIANGGVPLVLPAGDYWLVANPRVNIEDISVGETRWNWFDAGVPENGVNEAHLIDPSDIFGAGATSWTSLTNLGVSFASVAFTIEGEPEVLANSDTIAELASVYPNPANEVLNVEFPSSVIVKNSSLFNLLGQDTGVQLQNGMMNISDLTKGIYILNVETSLGTLTQKVFKK